MSDDPTQARLEIMQRITALEVAKDFLQRGIEQLEQELRDIGTPRRKRPLKMDVSDEDRARRAADAIKARAVLAQKRAREQRERNEIHDGDAKLPFEPQKL